MPVFLTQRGRAATKQEKGLGDIKMLWQDDFKALKSSCHHHLAKPYHFIINWSCLN
jgi:hypothetical protein